MTGDQVKGKGFRGALRYNLAKVEKGVAEVLDTNFSSRQENTIMKEVAMIKALRPNLQKYFYHTSLNFPPNENLSNEQMRVIAKEYLSEMGFNQHQFMVFRHRDADHPHIHILVNRIGFDGEVVTDSQDYARSEKVIRAIEKKYNLTPVVSSKQAVERALTKNEMEMMKRTDELSVKIKLQTIVNNAQKQSRSVAEFIQSLEVRGVNVLFNQAQTGFVSGISYGFEGLIFKGSALGNGFKWTQLKGSLNYEQERDHTTICEANLRTRSILSDIGLQQTVRDGAVNQTMASNELKRATAITQSASGKDFTGVSNNTGRLRPSAKRVERTNAISEEPSRRNTEIFENTKETGVLVGGIIRELLSPVDSYTHENLAALNEFKKKKKKRKIRR
ncbi:relaxase/mobilization nuclease domain-containing protein [Chitinophaga sp. Cy-1792]|uniref:relaxase/mobilization nuclease domain-containing protein n=1 Tax=Chitinophaga sp. Cy-1792 TaxID=2608339 RepID=UPI00141EFA1D|nr:relaxase/mobilization nuclease domain-containing protein [Chitinophaga sp. Cy-1792]NIG52508.1 relaxase/mobilization nuclease domain-containing protein [Chitinophaga sp. Cy-1792]